MIWFKLFMLQKNINTFDALTFRQVCMEENKDKNGCIQKK